MGRRVKLAKADHVQDAALQFEESRAINPDVVASNGYGNQTADEIARVIAAEALSTEGYTLAMQDEPELEKVIELLSRAKELNPDADFADPQGYARYLVAKNFLAQAKKRVSGGDMQAALVRISEAFSTYGYTDLLRDDGLWSELCWELSLAGFAREVLDNCELAVDEMSNTPDLRGGRGLARSLTGNYAGAAEDFQRWLDGMPIMPPQNVGVVERSSPPSRGAQPIRCTIP
ncbi:MAG: hypothetical protein H6647_11205 [Anaerolineales bacterium]|nr:hypothetical protein [Anaerolineales bacterium]